MKNHLVIDTCVYISYASNGKLYRIANAVDKYSLCLYVDGNLMAEFERNLLRLSLKMKIDVKEGIFLLEMVSILVQTIPLFKNSPDTKDNFLFDLAIQTNSEMIVTKEKALLNFLESPIPIHDIKWFKETYPVGL